MILMEFYTLIMNWSISLAKTWTKFSQTLRNTRMPTLPTLFWLFHWNSTSAIKYVTVKSASFPNIIWCKWRRKPELCALVKNSNWQQCQTRTINGDDDGGEVPSTVSLSGWITRTALRAPVRTERQRPVLAERVSAETRRRCLRRKILDFKSLPLFSCLNTVLLSFIV